MTRSPRTTLQPLQDSLLEQLAKLHERRLEEERQHREAEAWWDAYDLRTALERRGELA